LYRVNPLNTSAIAIRESLFEEYLKFKSTILDDIKSDNGLSPICEIAKHMNIVLEKYLNNTINFTKANPHTAEINRYSIDEISRCLNLSQDIASD
jgi:hypothetical protein